MEELTETTVWIANQVELVDDFLRKAKQLEYLISILPSSSDSTTSPDTATTGEDDDEDLVELEKEMKLVNEEYLDALATAGTLLSFFRHSDSQY
jgi:hypothetical protein